MSRSIDALADGSVAIGINLSIALLCRPDTVARFPLRFLEIAALTALVALVLAFTAAHLTPRLCGDNPSSRRLGTVAIVVLSGASPLLDPALALGFVPGIVAALCLACVAAVSWRSAGGERWQIEASRLGPALAVTALAVWTYRYGLDGTILLVASVFAAILVASWKRNAFSPGLLAAVGVCFWIASPMLVHVGSRLGGADPEGRPSIVLLTIDTLRADDLESTATPSIDRLAADANVWTQAWSPAP